MIVGRPQRQGAARPLAARTPPLFHSYAALPTAFAVGLTLAAVSCTYASDGAPLTAAPAGLELIAALPEPGSRDVPIDATIELTFDVPLASDSVHEGRVWLQSGRFSVPATLAVDLLDRRLSIVPAQPLRSGLRHRVHVAAGVRGLNGARLTDALTFEFTTAEDAGAPARRVPAALSASDLQPLWDARCSSCHGADRPRAGVDLSSPAAARRSLVGVGSTQVARPRVAAGDHASSYLIHKLLGRFGIGGLPMPPEPDAQLDATELRRVADWIDGGAR